MKIGRLAELKIAMDFLITFIELFLFTVLREKKFRFLNLHFTCPTFLYIKN